MEPAMNAQKLEVLAPLNLNSDEDEFTIPLDIQDIISICKEYNQLGWKIQNQIQDILEMGIEECIKTNKVNKESLPHIKNFLQQIAKNPYFGDSIFQAEECIYLINEYEHSINSILN